jgi:hypothetical protein
MLKSQLLCFGVFGQTLAHLPKKIPNLYDFLPHFNQTQIVIFQTTTKHTTSNDVLTTITCSFLRFKKKTSKKKKNTNTLEAFKQTRLHLEAKLSGFEKLKKEIVLWFSLA